MTYFGNVFSGSHDDGDISHSVDTKAWLSTSKALPENSNILEALATVQPRLDFTVSSRKSYFHTAEGKLKEATSKRMIVRDDTEVELHAASDGYVPIQNEEAFAPLQVLQNEHGARLNALGQLRDGKVVWAHLTLPESMGSVQVKNGEDRVIANHILARTAHDGTSRLCYSLIPFESIHCSNQLAAFAAGVDTEWKVSHTKNAESALKKATQVFGQFNENFAGFVQILQQLEDVPMTTNEFIEFSARWLQAIKGSPGKSAKDSDRVQRAIEKREEEIELLTEYFENGINCYGRTRGDAYQAVTEHMTHGRERAREARGADGLTTTQRERLFGALTMGKGRADTSQALRMLRTN